MANITKSFNFRNGVQVDDDNLLVNPSGLVGIGTTVPTQSLDVRGNAVVSGLVSSTDAKFTNLEVTNLTTGSNNLALGVDKIIGAGVSIRAGIVTADLDTNPLGVVTYYGDGGQLNNIPTSQWVDKDAGLGFISIYNTGYVGVNTDDPRYSLQVGGNNDVNNFDKPGVGIASDGAIVATGIITAKTNFDGNLLGNIQGGIGTITQVLSTNANVTGIVTAGIGFTGDLRGNVVSGLSTFTQVRSINIENTGIITSTSGFVGNVFGDVTGDVTGALSGDVVGVAATFSKDVEIGGSVTGINTLTTTRLVSANASTGLTTVTTLNVIEKLGVGIPAPANNAEVFSTGFTTSSVVGSKGATILIGQRTLTGIGESSSAIRFGANDKTLEIINGDLGDFTNIIHGGNFTGINTGSFKWIYGPTNTNLLTLDYQGNLGINKQNPETTLDVIGVSTFKGDVKVDGDLEITGSLTGNVPLPALIFGTNIYNTTGVSTFIRVDCADIEVNRTIGVTSVAIGTHRDNHLSGIAIDAQRGTVLFNRVGIGSTVPQTTLDVKGDIDAGGIPGNVSTETLVVGKDAPACAVDFSDAGQAWTGMNAGKQFMYPPKITTTQRGNLVSVTAGAMIYNKTTNKMQVYNGSSWVNMH